MKLKYEFEMIDMDNETIAVPLDNEDSFTGLIKLNESGTVIFKMLQNDCTEADIVDALMEEYEADRERIAGYVHGYVEGLKKDGIVG